MDIVAGRRLESVGPHRALMAPSLDRGVDMANIRPVDGKMLSINREEMVPPTEFESVPPA